MIEKWRCDVGLFSKIKSAAKTTFGAIEKATGVKTLGGSILGRDKKKSAAPAADPTTQAVDAAAVAAQADVGVAELERKRRLRAASLLTSAQQPTAGTGTLLGGG